MNRHQVTRLLATSNVEDKLFAGDAIFYTDTVQVDVTFPNGNAAQLYDSIKDKIYTLDDETEIYVGHDYQPGGGRELKFKTTVGNKKSIIFI